MNRRNMKASSKTFGIKTAISKLKYSPVIWVFTLILLTNNLGWSQADLGSLTGRVTDTSGAVIANSVIEVRNVATSDVRQSRSDSQGVYSVPALPAGAYTVTVSAEGFRKVVSTTQVTLNGTTGLDLKLPVGSASETVTVTGGSDLATLQTESHELSQTFVQQQLTQLPTNGRSVLSVAVLGPGSQPGSDVNTIGGGSPNFFGATNNTVFLQGLSNIHTSFLQDGVENTNLLTQAANILPSVESVQETNVQLNGASARFDEPTVINIITKSGSNAFHGTAYDFIQNNALDAKNYFSKTIPTIRYNLFGANLGGPIIKNKLFFFFDYSGLRSKQGSVASTRVPTQNERNGIFDAPGDMTIYDPSTYNPVTGSSQPFLNNTITGAPNSFAALFAKYYPMPNTPLVNNVNYVANLANTASNNQYLGRIDWNISDKNHLYGSVLTANTPVVQASIVDGLFGTIFGGASTNIAVEDTFIISPRLVNVARVGYNRSNYSRSAQGVGSQNYAQVFGLQNLNPQPQQWAPPAVSIANYQGVGDPYGLGDPYAPQGAIQNRFQYADEVNYTIGKHSLFLGAEVYRTQFDGNWVVNQNGNYGFDGRFTSQYVNGQRSSTNQGNAYADFLLGFPNYAYGATGVTVGAFRQYDVAAYIQDDWKLFPTLTLNLGFRYDFDNPPSDKNGRSAIYDAATYSPRPGTWDTNYKDFAPRIGFAWSVHPTTVLRGGYGIYYTRSPYNMLQFELLYPPNWISQGYTFQIAAPTPIQNAFVANPSSKGQSPYTLSEKMPDTSAQTWNLGVEQSLGSQVTASLAYAGNVGRHISLRRDGNQPLPIGTPPFTTRPYPNIGSFVQQGNFASSNYNALLATITGHPTKDLTLLASYTWSKSMDLADGDDTLIENSYQPSLTYALAGFDRTNQFVVSSVYELPFGPGKAMMNSNNLLNRTLIGGWQVGEVYRLTSGQPTSITANNSADTGYGESFANKICNPSTSRKGLQWFDPTCFVQPGPGVYGHGGRDSVRGPRLNLIDLSAVKNFQIYEAHQIQFRAEAFNALNHPVLELGPGQGVTSPSLGTLNTALPGRILQFALRYSF